MIFGEEHLIALDVTTDRQLECVQGLPAKWRGTVKRRVATEAMGLIPTLQKTTIRLIEEQAKLMEQTIQEQAELLQRARKNFEEATEEKSKYELKDWKQELSRL